MGWEWKIIKNCPQNYQIIEYIWILFGSFPKNWRKEWGNSKKCQFLGFAKFALIISRNNISHHIVRNSHFAKFLSIVLSIYIEVCTSYTITLWLNSPALYGGLSIKCVTYKIFLFFIKFCWNLVMCTNNFTKFQQNLMKSKKGLCWMNTFDRILPMCVCVISKYITIKWELTVAVKIKKPIWFFIFLVLNCRSNFTL